MPCRFAREGEAAAREGEAEARDGEAEAREGEAEAREGEAEAREGEAEAREGDTAKRLSALDVILPAATAAPRASGIHSSLWTPRPPPGLMMSTGRAGPGIGRDRNEPGGGTFCTEAGLREEGSRSWAGPHFVCLRALGVGG